MIKSKVFLKTLENDVACAQSLDIRKGFNISAYFFARKMILIIFLDAVVSKLCCDLKKNLPQVPSGEEQLIPIRN